MASADFCTAMLSHCCKSCYSVSGQCRPPGISNRSFVPSLPDLHRADIGNTGFTGF